MKLLIALLTATLLATTVNASSKINENIKKQCQYLVHGNGVNNFNVGMYMYGIISGIVAMSDLSEASEFAKTAERHDISYKACQRALVNKNNLVFEQIYVIELMNVIRK